MRRVGKTMMRSQWRILILFTIAFLLACTCTIQAQQVLGWQQNLGIGSRGQLVLQDAWGWHILKYESYFGGYVPEFAPRPIVFPPYAPREPTVWGWQPYLGRIYHEVCWEWQLLTYNASYGGYVPTQGAPPENPDATLTVAADSSSMTPLAAAGNSDETPTPTAEDSSDPRTSNKEYGWSDVLNFSVADLKSHPLPSLAYIVAIIGFLRLCIKDLLSRMKGKAAGN
jgi:hypothetical protein